jgi:hypothetical protein
MPANHGIGYFGIFQDANGLAQPLVHLLHGTLHAIPKLFTNDFEFDHRATSALHGIIADFAPSFEAILGWQRGLR